MNKIYILVPLIGLLIFGGFYWNFEKGYDAKLAASKAKEKQMLEDKRKADQAAREVAYKAAIEAANRRKAEREERERIEEAKKKARLDAEDRRQVAFEDRRKAREKVEDLKKDLDNVKSELTKLEEEKKQHADELAFLKDFVKKTEASQKYYYDLLDKIDAADKARAAAEAAAKAAAKS